MTTPREQQAIDLLADLVGTDRIAHEAADSFLLDFVLDTHPEVFDAYYDVQVRAGDQWFWGPAQGWTRVDSVHP